METVYDWVTVGIFAGLVVLFLQRSVGEQRDSMWPYFAASVMCMLINQVGNKAVETGDLLTHAAATAGVIGILAFVHHFLRPFGNPGD